MKKNWITLSILSMRALRDIHDDIVYSRKVFKKIKNKYFINNRSLDQVVNELVIMKT